MCNAAEPTAGHGRGRRPPIGCDTSVTRLRDPPHRPCDICVTLRNLLAHNRERVRSERGGGGGGSGAPGGGGAFGGSAPAGEGQLDEGAGGGVGGHGADNRAGPPREHDNARTGGTVGAVHAASHVRPSATAAVGARLPRLIGPS
eukprot:1363973-Pyramimonas_sp.AAC.1